MAREPVDENSRLSQMLEYVTSDPGETRVHRVRDFTSKERLHDRLQTSSKFEINVLVS
jgi:hypothetical protein